jgi:hypothetical protein
MFAATHYAHVGPVQAVTDPSWISWLRQVCSDPQVYETVREQAEAVLGQAGYQDPNALLQYVDYWCEQVLRACTEVVAPVHVTLLYDALPLVWIRELQAVAQGVLCQPGHQLRPYSEAGFYTPPYLEQLSLPAEVSASFRALLPPSAEDEPPESWGYGSQIVGRVYALQEAVCRMLEQHGVRAESLARVMGDGICQRAVWSTDVQQLAQVLRGKSCWYTPDHWLDAGRETIEAMRGVDRLFGCLGRPPCWRDGFVGCDREVEATQSWLGQSPLPVCPIWYQRHSKDKDLPASPYVQTDVSVTTQLEGVVVGGFRKWDAQRLVAAEAVWGEGYLVLAGRNGEASA